MITFEVHPEIHVREMRERLLLCEHCFDAMQNHREPVISVHVRPRPQRRSTL
jgi:hypothetical protein